MAIIDIWMILQLREGELNREANNDALSMAHILRLSRLLRRHVQCHFSHQLWLVESSLTGCEGVLEADSVEHRSAGSGERRSTAGAACAEGRPSWWWRKCNAERLNAARCARPISHCAEFGVRLPLRREST